MQPPKQMEATVAEKRPYGEEVMWFRLSLSQPMPFLPGQYVSLRFPGEKRYHAFSIASSPSREEEIELVIKRSHDFTTRLLDSPPGTRLECMGPLGHFLQDLEEDVVMIAGGVGVTPFLGLLRWARDTRADDRQYWLFYSCREREQLVLEEELRALHAEDERLHVVLTLTREEPEGWDEERGRIDKELLLRHLGSFERKSFYTCGPTRMVAAIMQMLHDAGVPPARIRHESWS